jgi:quercetin dioxygenase-like cupin family protein
MKTGNYNVLNTLFAIMACLFFSTAALAQDAEKVAPDQYKVEFENDQVRVLRITYAPGETSAMHEHPAGVAVFLTDHLGKFTFPDGKTEEIPGKAGQVIWAPAGKHAAQNIGDESFELILVELKSKDKMQKKEE